jgi:hypothetical protein
MSPGGRRRRGSGPGVVTIYWRDIPAQITVTDAEDQTEKVLLEPRFQHAIDRAAHVAGLTETQDYVEQWRRVSGVLDGEPAEVAQAAAAEIHSDYPRDRLEALVASGGLEPDGGQEQ